MQCAQNTIYLWYFISFLIVIQVTKFNTESMFQFLNFALRNKKSMRNGIHEWTLPGPFEINRPMYHWEYP